MTLMVTFLKMATMRKWAALAAACAWLSVPAAEASIVSLPGSLAHEVLSESVPTAFAPFGLSVADYAFEWDGPAIEGVELRLVEGSLWWVRAMDVLSLPRARVEILAKGAEGGRVSNAGFSQALAPSPASGVPPAAPGSTGADRRADLPIALISGERNAIELAIIRDGRELRGRALLRFRPRPELGAERVFYDASCSRFGLSAAGLAQSASARGWAYVGCRLVEQAGEPNLTSTLEAFVFWDNVGQSVDIGGTATPSTLVSTWPLRLAAAPGQITLEAHGSAPRGGAAEDLTLSYRLPSAYHRGSLGLGIGPYTDRFEGPGADFSGVTVVPTVYGSYFVTEAIRVVAFGALTLDPYFTTDLGVYLHTQYMRILDNRLVASLLLGAHGIGFRLPGRGYHVIPGFPQGVELTATDVFKKGSNLTGGFFLYPEIADRSYYNMWVRWGSGRLFYEANYIEWSERAGDDLVKARYFGLSIGFPLARFF